MIRFTTIRKWKGINESKKISVNISLSFQVRFTCCFLARGMDCLLERGLVGAADMTIGLAIGTGTGVAGVRSKSKVTEYLDFG